MNVRIDPNSIRFRLTTAEFTQLRQDRQLRQVTALNDRRSLVYALHCAPLPALSRGNVLHLDVVDEGADVLFSLMISPEAEQTLNTPIPSKDGITDYQPLANGGILTVGLDIDIRSGGKSA